MSRSRIPKALRVKVAAQARYRVIECQADADGLGVITVMADKQRPGAGDLVAIRPHVTSIGLVDLPQMRASVRELPRKFFPATGE